MKTSKQVRNVRDAIAHKDNGAKVEKREHGKDDANGLQRLNLARVTARDGSVHRLLEADGRHGGATEQHANERACVRYKDGTYRTTHATMRRLEMR